MSNGGELGAVAWRFLRLGCTSFGGPVAHIGAIRRACVDDDGWLDDAHFADLVALCQFLPGPASSQLVFALGLHRAGLAGALVASTMFTAPSAALMIAFAVGVGRSGLHPGVVFGLKLAAVAVVASAVWTMGQKLCPDLTRRFMAVASASAIIAFPAHTTQLVVIAASAVVGVFVYARAMRHSAALQAASMAPPDPPTSTPRWKRAWGSVIALTAFFALLVALPVVAAHDDHVAVDAFDAFYRAGALVFGGGHVVLPLLHAEVVPRGWLSDEQFLAGYGVAQALPGPLFTFAAYVGAAMESPGPRWLFGLWCLVGVFLPGWLLVGAALPAWSRLRSTPVAQAALAGAQAAVVGVLLAALITPMMTSTFHADHAGAVAIHVGVAVAAVVALERLRAPSWLVVVACAVLGWGLSAAGLT